MYSMYSLARILGFQKQIGKMLELQIDPEQQHPSNYRFWRMGIIPHIDNQ